MMQAMSTNNKVKPLPALTNWSCVASFLNFWKMSIVAIVAAEFSMDANEETTAPKIAASTNQVMPGFMRLRSKIGKAAS